MTQLKSPIIWRLILLFLFLFLIPISIVMYSMQQQARQSILDSQLRIVSYQARAYSLSIEKQPGKEQEFAAEMTNTAKGDVFFLLAPNWTYQTHSNPEKIGRSALEDFRSATLRKLMTGTSTSVLDEAKGQLIGSYRASLENPLAVSVGNIEQKTAELNSFVRNLVFRLSIVFIISSLIGGAAIIFTLNPLIGIVKYASEVGKGNLSFQLDDKKFRGEMATLASSLKNLVANVQTSITSLEKRVTERTRELEHRSKLLEAVADVGKVITSFRDLSDLLQQASYLIHENFGYYHVGIFLLDEHKEYAVLTATNSEGGFRMLEKKHQLKVGETGIVGYVTQNAKARIALDVGQDKVYFDNPDLPQTRSEMALPLVIGGQILGALDVQSTEPQAFSEEDTSTLQILAEQIAIAIQNANLFNEAEKALETSRVSYGEVSRGAWGKILRTQPRIGFLATPPTTVQIHSENLESNLAKAIETGDLIIGSDGLTISMPIRVRGQTIGAIRLKKSAISESWTQDETNLAISLSDQLSGALESARLYKDAQQLAARESLISDISARISAVSQTDAILRETVQELGQTIGNASVTFQLLDQLDVQKQAKSGVFSKEHRDNVNSPKGQDKQSETSDGARKVRE